MSIDNDPLQSINLVEVPQRASEQMLAMIAMGETFSTNNERNARNAELALEMSTGEDPAAAKQQLMLNTLPLIRHHLFGYLGTKSPEQLPPALRMYQDNLNEAAVVDADDVWQAVIEHAYRYGLPGWKVEAGSLSTYLKLGIRQTKVRELSTRIGLTKPTNVAASVYSGEQLYYSLGYETRDGSCVSQRPYTESDMPVVSNLVWIDDRDPEVIEIGGDMPALVPAEEQDMAVNGFENDLVSQVVAEGLAEWLLGTLTERTRSIVELYYGLSDGKPMTSDQLGKLYGVSGTRIRQICDIATKRMAELAYFKAPDDFPWPDSELSDRRTPDPDQPADLEPTD